MFILGTASVFIGISLLAPDDSKGILMSSLLRSIISEIWTGTYSLNFQVVRLKTIHL